MASANTAIKPDRTFIDPLASLPYEIYIKVLQFAVYTNAEGPLSLLGVSRSWEKTIIETPELWTNIEINNDEDVVARAMAFLHLSGNRLISLRIVTPLHSLEPLKLVLHERQRIYTVVFGPLRMSSSGTYHTNDVLELFEDRENRDFSFPELREVIVEDAPVEAVPQRLLSSPKLYAVSGKYLRAVDESFISHSVRDMGYVFRNSRELDLLGDRTFNSLKLLNANHGWSSSEYLNPRVLKTTASTLRYFFLETWHLHLCLDNFFSHSYPRLHTLETQLPPDMVQILFASLRLFPELKDLSIHLVSTFWRDRTEPISDVTDGLPALRHITLHDETGTTDRPALRDFVRYFSGHFALRQLQSIRFSLMGSIPELSLVLPLLNSVPTVQTVYVRMKKHSDRSYMEDDPTQVYTPANMPNLRILTLESIRHLSLFEAPQLERLTILKPRDDEALLQLITGIEKSLSHLEIDWESFRAIDNEIKKQTEKSEWPKLSEVRWSNWSKSCEDYVTSLCSLTSIELPHTFLGGVRNPFNALCYTLLCHPKACPALHIIKARQYPRWDLLFAFLRHRQSEPAVKEITSIYFPAAPVAPVLRILVNTLAGKTENVPQVDTVISKRRKWRSKLPFTCASCIFAGYIHCLLNESDPGELSEKVKTISTDELQELMDSLDFELTIPSSGVATSIDLEGLVATLEEEDAATDFSSCSRYNFEKLIEINSYTPIGEYHRAP